ncbi:FAD/NAD(P)-binding domain-containing protein [Cryphonectria parasitica EP155]|uniref:FAD/NAD(P)-binding domain-containing protein n=1 Tax=Cryphonectria parasitica (strain ATCC 38755 / EP155) TaxID=660469 RepID=A0A9P5CMH1_CRYP1|nr:FAD/NAD(P)-binding domain-containing protein [Cryphonectria parasitica EP155]KAF3763086.1 FAD/NAD(P)-binding domain-containing protein [Cryphonectria parasitica EP155]
MKPAKRVAVIGAGPSGAITVDALARENVFEVIKVFERRDRPGGCWVDDKEPPAPLTNLAALAARTADPPVPIPASLPARTPLTASSSSSSEQPRFVESSIYPYLETNVEDAAMCFTGGGVEVIPAERSAWSISMHGENTPFRHWTVMRRYVEALFAREGYGGWVQYGTCVEKVEKDVGTEEWILTLRRREEEAETGGRVDSWWQERFDAVVVASGHFNVPYIPAVEGLDEFERNRPGSVLHSKMYRGRDAFRGMTVVVVGASVSGADIAYDLASHRVTRDGGIVHAIVVGHNFNIYFKDEAFHHPLIRRHPSIARVDAATRTVHLIDGTSIEGVDHIIFGTGYSWSLPFLPQEVCVRNNRVADLYQHVVWREDPTLLFVGAVGAGLTFKIFEWQAVYAARLLAGRGQLPSKEEMRVWEEERIARKGDGPKFQMIFPEFEEYFEDVRRLAGEPTASGEGRTLPKFEEAWFRSFMEGHDRRIEMWRRENQKAREELQREKGGKEEEAALQSHI